MSIADGPVIIGGGPSGLAAAIELRRLGVGPVTVIERERQAGGIPRHSNHTGFGARDLRRVMSGPRYAERYRALAADAGVDVVSETMVTDWDGPRSLWLTGPGGRRRIEPSAVVLATGCRERPRSARLVPGMRGPGVITTGMLQQLVYLKGQRRIGASRGRCRRRARQLLRRCHPRPRRRLDGRAGHRACRATSRSAPFASALGFGSGRRS